MCPILFVGRHMRPRQGHAWGGLCFTEWSGRLVMLRWGGQDDRFTQIITTMIQQDYNGDHSGEDPQHSEREARAGDRDLICCLPRWEGGVVVGVVVVLGVNRDLICCLSSIKMKRWGSSVPGWWRCCCYCCFWCYFFVLWKLHFLLRFYVYRREGRKGRTWTWKVPHDENLKSVSPRIQC